MNLNEFFFPVQEREVLLHPETDRRVRKIPDHKAIVARVNGVERVVSVVRNSYKLVPNKEVIEPFLERIESMNVKWHIDESHTFVEPNHMQLQLRFPDLYVRDVESLIPLTLHLRNSYDRSVGVQLWYGAIRAICSNGLILSSLLGAYYAKHTSGFSFDRLEHQFNETVNRIGDIQKQVDRLSETAINDDLISELQQALGKKRLNEIVETDRLPAVSQWELLNKITHHVSHQIEKPRRAEFQLKVSRVFQL